MKAIDIITNFLADNRGQSFTVGYLAGRLDVSSSRIRELLPTIPGVVESEAQTEVGKAKAGKSYGFPAVQTTGELVQAYAEAVQDSVEEKLHQAHAASNALIADFMASEEGKAPVQDAPTQAEEETPEACPFCGSHLVSPAGKAGTFLGDAVLRCDGCQKGFNKFSRQEVPVAEKKRKGPINPQYKINAKVDAVAKLGGTLAYDKATRKWVLTIQGTETQMNSLDLSAFDPATLQK